MRLYEKFVTKKSKLEDFLYSIGLIPDLFNIVLEYAKNYSIHDMDNYTEYNCEDISMREYKDIAIIYDKGKPKLYINKKQDTVCNSQFIYITRDVIEDSIGHTDIFDWYRDRLIRNIKNYKETYFEFNFETSKRKDKQALYLMGCIKGLFTVFHKKHTFDYLYALYESNLSEHDTKSCPYSRYVLINTLMNAGYSCSGTKSEMYFMIDFYNLHDELLIESKK